MPNEDPFQFYFETFGKLTDAHSENVNREAREKLLSYLKVPLEKAGHFFLLKAPRAGHGKTHLLTRIHYELGGTHEFIPIHAISGSRVDAATVLDDTLRRLIRGLPAAGGLTVLDLIARRLFSNSLQPLVNSGEVPCQNREGAIHALRTRPIETFDFHHPSAVTAHWARDNFNLLGPRLALELSQSRGLSLREVSFWVDAMFRFAATPIDNPGRVRALAATVFDNPAAETVAHERLIALLGLLTSIMRVVLIADEIEGFSANETAALRFASFLGTLKQNSDHLDIILSINDDVWTSAFLPRLSGGLTDRLSEVVIQLEPLTRASMRAIIEAHAPGHGEKILTEIPADPALTHARGILKAAGAAWASASAAPSLPAPPSPEVPQITAPAIIAEPAPVFTPVPPAPIAEPAPVFTPAPPAPIAEPAPVFTPAPPAPAVIAPEPAAIFTAPESITPPAPETPTRNTFSPEAAIAAFALTQQPQPAAEITPADLAAPPSWPSPDVGESAFTAPPVIPAPAAPVFQPAPPEPPTPFTAAPPEPPNPFTAAPAPLVAELAPVFQAAPAPAPVAPTFQPPYTPPPEAVSAFQPPTETISDDQNDSSTTDRVDELLRQFRERYGKA